MNPSTQTARNYLERATKSRAARAGLLAPLRAAAKGDKRAEFRKLVQGVQAQYPNPNRVDLYLKQARERLQGIEIAIKYSDHLPCGHQDGLVAERDALRDLVTSLELHAKPN